jgi:hypothetical protein
MRTANSGENMPDLNSTPVTSSRETGRESLDDFEMYKNALVLQPSSANLAKQIFDHCRNRHRASLQWPVGNAGWIIAEPNYFAFQCINTEATAVTVDLRPSNWNYFKPYNTGDDARRVELRGRALRGRFGDSSHAQITIRSELQLQIAFRMLDFAHSWVTDRDFQGHERKRMRDAHRAGQSWQFITEQDSRS